MSSPYAPKIYPCVICGAPDGRDAAHARGCPRLAAYDLDKQKLLALARAVEDAWAAKYEPKQARTAVA